MSIVTNDQDKIFPLIAEGKLVGIGTVDGDPDQEDIQRREIHQSSIGVGRRNHGPESLRETLDSRPDILSLAEPIGQHDGVTAGYPWLQVHDFLP